MNGPKLVKMANDIAAFFEGEGDREHVLSSVAGHLKRFWDPRMRREIVRWVDERSGEGLRESVVAAIRANRETLLPK